MNWVLQVIELLFCWIPRLYYVNPDENGVRIALGKYIKKVSPGWYWNWPLIHQFVKINVATQGLTLAAQSVTTADEVDLAVRGAILYRITDAKKAIFETDDFDRSLEAVAGGVIEQFVSSKTYEQLKDREALKDEIRRGLREEARGWGIKIQRVFVPDIGRVRNIRVLGDPKSVIPMDTD